MKTAFLHILIVTLSFPAFAEKQYPTGNSIKQNLIQDLGPDGINPGPKVNALQFGQSPSTIKNYPDADGLPGAGYNDRAGKALESYLLEKHAEAESKGVWADTFSPGLTLGLPGSSGVEKKTAAILSDWSDKAIKQSGEFGTAAERNRNHCKLLRRPFNQGKEGVDGVNDWVGCDESTIESSNVATNDTVFSDAALTKLEESGVDTKSLKYKLERGDFDGAKEILNRVGQEKTLSDAEDELADLAARRIRLGSYKKRLGGTGYQNDSNGGGGHAASEDDGSGTDSGGTIDAEPSGSDGGSGADETRVRLIRKTSAVGQVPGLRTGDERIYVPKARRAQNTETSESDNPSQATQVEMDTNYDVLKLKERGVRKLIPGMNIFRFAHHRYSEWDSHGMLTQN